MKGLCFLSLSIVLLVALSNSPSHAGSAALEGGANNSGEAILAKYRAFMGWTLGDPGSRSMRIAGQIADQSRFDEICEPGRFAQFNIGLASGRPFLVAGDQGSVWVSHDGVPHYMPSTMAQDSITETLLLCNAFAAYPSTIVSEVALAGTNSKSGYAVVAVQPPNTAAIILSINKDTGEPTSFVINGIATYTPADLRPIDSKRRIYTRWKRLLPGGTTADMTISKLQLNVAIDPSIFSQHSKDVPPAPDPAPVVSF
jgi:hypothetical protein